MKEAEQRPKHRGLTVVIKGDTSGLNRELKKSRKLATKLNEELERTCDLMARLRS